MNLLSSRANFGLENENSDPKMYWFMFLIVNIFFRLTSTVNLANPVARQAGATFFHGAPLVPHPIVPILPPPPRTIVIEEPAPPEPETVRFLNF